MKKKYTPILLLLISILAMSCETRFEDDLRILVRGNLEDESGIAVADAEINVYSDRGSCLFCPGEFLLGKNFSQSDGSFEVISLFDKQEDFLIKITSDVNYTDYTYFTSTLDYIPDDLMFNLETIQLKNVGTVNYNITRTSETANTISISFKYNNTSCREFYVDGELDPTQSYCFEPLSFDRVLDDNRPDLENSFKTPFGTEVEFTYSINDAEPITETFTINQSTYDFNFSY